MTEIKSFTVKNNDVAFWREFTNLKWKDRCSVSELIILAAREYYDRHKDGNPNFTLEQFDEKDFKACPALFRKKEAWQKYYKKLTKIEYDEINSQIMILLDIHNKELKRF